MAKDKEKEKFSFKGADDKAITFQRAVFIVCNLKRLIKRPKKEDKNFASGSRKRSGGLKDASDQFDDSDCANGQAGGFGQGLSAAGSRNPVRRAFTLPTMLCQTLAGGGASDQFSANQLHDFQSTSEQNDETVVQHPQFVADHKLPGETTAADGKLFIREQTIKMQQQQHQLRPVINVNQSNQCWPSDLGQLDEQAACDFYLGDHVEQQQQQQLRASQSRHSSPTNPNFHRPSENNSSQLGSLSCLVTPIRRAGAGQSRANRSDDKQTKPTTGADCAWSSQQPQHRQTGLLNQQQLWCPIWALAMEILDQQQEQPRDQARHSHLVGPPAPVGFTLAPKQQPQQASQRAPPTGQQSEQTQDELLSISQPRHRGHQQPDGEEPGERVNNLETRKVAKTNDTRAPNNSFKQIPMKRFSSAICLNEDKEENDNSENRAEKHVQLQHQTNQVPPATGRRQQQQQQQPTIKQQLGKLSISSFANQNTDSAPAQSGVVVQKQKSHSRDNASSLLASQERQPPGPARRSHRRPSISDRGNSINVDQQALFSAVECNQLERVKTILDSGKANVNSLSGDKLTCLDIAVLMRNVEMAQLLQHYNAKESSAYLNSIGRANQLYSLYIEARRQVEDLSRSLEAIRIGPAAAAVASCNFANYSQQQQQQQAHPNAGQQQQATNPPQIQSIGSREPNSPFSAGGGGGASNKQANEQQQQPQLMLATGSLLSSALLEEKQRQLQYWKRRLELFMHMRYEFEKLELPNAPELAVLQVTGESSLGIKIIHSLKSTTTTAAANSRRPSNLNQPDEAADQETSTTTTAAARPHLCQLVSLSRARGLHCSLGPKCSHWLMSEFCSSNNNSLLLDSGGHDSFCPRRDELDAASRSTTNASRRDNQLKRQQHLAVFNHLLAQQLALLSNQQEQFLDEHPHAHQQQRSPLSLANKTMGRLKYCHQNESTDTAYDHIGPTLSRSPLTGARNSDQPSLDWSPSNPIVSSQSAKLKANANQQPQYHSLAYQLMTSRVESNKQHRQRQFNHRHSVRCNQSGNTTLSGPRESQPLAAKNHSCCCNQTTSPAASSAAATGFASQRCIITKYKIEWSLDEQFADDQSTESMIIYNTANLCPIECRIGQLLNGCTYYCQVSAGNHRGFSEPIRTTPVCLAPSSWRQLDPATPSADSTGGGGGGGGGSQRSAKKAKYDEEVFRKFTKLILLNKHILDENQTSSLQQQLLTGQTNDYLLAQNSNSNNKSSLINMLLLDATTPSESESTGGSKTTSGHSSGRGSILYLGGEQAAGTTAPDQQYKQANQENQRETSLKVTRKNLKNFFQSNSTKFHKLTNQNKRGLYLATVIYHSPSGAGSAAAAATAPDQQQSSKFNFDRRKLSSDSSSQQSQLCFKVDQLDKIVVTNDDRLPIIEISNDLVSTTMLTGDFNWLLKINGTQWLDIKRLRQQLQKSHSSSTLHLRIKLLLAIEQMQLALNMEDIGRLFYKPIQAHDGSILICTCKHLASTKLLGNLSVKWTYYGKIIPRHLMRISNPNDRQTTSEQQQQQLEQARTKSTQQQTKKQQQHQDQLNSTTILPATILNALVSMDQPQQQSQSGSFSSASTSFANQQQQQSDQSTTAGATSSLATLSNQLLLSQLPPEAQKLCESCQLKLAQRQSAMTSASSSSTSLASNDSLSQWSVGQFSLVGPTGAANQQQQQQLAARQRQSCSCTCSRSNSGCQTNLANTLLVGGQQQQQQLQQTAPANYMSAPGSQRNSTSARSGSLMGGNSGGACALSLGAGQQPFAFGGNNTNSNNSYQQQQHSASFSAQSGASQPSRQTQSQQLVAPQKSSTYLMLASLSLYELLLYNLNEIIEFDQTSTLPLNRGLYLGFVQLQTTVESMRLLVPRARPNMLPCARIRDNAHVSKEEWQRLKRFATNQQQTRASDPSIWSLNSNTDSNKSNEQLSVRQQYRTGDLLLVDDEHGDSRTPTATNLKGNSFDRSRAKSMSPSAGNELELHRRQAQQEARRIGAASGSETNVDSTATIATSATEDCCCWSSSLSSDQITTTTTANTDQDDPNGEKCELVPGTQRGPTDGQLAPSSGEPSLPLGRQQGGNSYAHSDTDLALVKSMQQQQQQDGTHSSGSSSNRLTAAATSSSCNCSSTSDPNLTASARPATPANGNQTLGGQPTVDSSASPDTTITTSCATTTTTTTRRPVDRQRSRSPTGTSRLTVSSLALVASQSPEETFVRLIGSAARRLLDDLKSKLPKSYDEKQDKMISVLPALNDEENNRIYHLELIELSSEITFVLLIPAPENVCPVTSHERSNILADNRDFMLLPLQIFETIHISTYEPDLLGKYSRLSAVLETDLIVAQHDHRQAFSSNELKSTKSRVSRLQDMVAIADEFWRQLRWIVDVVSFARDKSQAASSSNSSAIRLATIWSYFDLSPTRSVTQGQSMSSIGPAAATTTLPMRPGHQAAIAERASDEQRQLTRSQLEVKRSTSAHTTGQGQRRSGRLRTGQVPEIQLTSTSGQLSQPQVASNLSPTTKTTATAGDFGAELPSGVESSVELAKQQQQQQRRRHSSDENSQAISKPPPVAKREDSTCRQADCPAGSVYSKRNSDDNDLRSINSGAIWDVEFGFANDDEDDGEQEAIYAYHISLRDATRAATQRKNSQHSVSVFIDQENLATTLNQQHQRLEARLSARQMSRDQSNSKRGRDNRFKSMVLGENIEGRRAEEELICDEAGGEQCRQRAAVTEESRETSDKREQAMETSDSHSGPHWEQCCSTTTTAADTKDKSAANELEDRQQGSDKLSKFISQETKTICSGQQQPEEEDEAQAGPNEQRQQQQQPRPPAANRRNLGQSKRTNPFLSDSFD